MDLPSAGFLFFHLPPVEVEEIALLLLRAFEDEVEVVNATCADEFGGQFLILELSVGHVDGTSKRTVHIVEAHLYAAAEYGISEDRVRKIIRSP